MAWMGDIWQRVSHIVCTDDTAFITLECRHVIESQQSTEEIMGRLRNREMECPECSAPTKARIKVYQDSISFDDVLTKLRGAK